MGKHNSNTVSKGNRAGRGDCEEMRQWEVREGQGKMIIKIKR